MKRYYFELLDASNNNLGACIPDGTHKSTAISQAKKWLQERSLTCAQLVVNSLRTDNILDIIDIEL